MIRTARRLIIETDKQSINVRLHTPLTIQDVYDKFSIPGKCRPLVTFSVPGDTIRVYLTI